MKSNIIKSESMKRIVALLLIVSMLLPLCDNAFAKNEKEISINFIEQYALHFMRESQEKDSIEVDGIFPLYGVDNEITGYYVTFSDRSKESGYIVISLLTSGCPVVELSFEGHGRLIEVIKERKKQIKNINNILYTGPDSFYIPEQNGYYSIYDKKTVSKESIALEYEEFRAAANRNTEIRSTHPIEDGIIDWAGSNVQASTIKKILYFGLGTNYWLMNDFEKNAGNCYPTAATNILWYWGKMRDCNSVLNAVSCTSYVPATAKKIYNKVHNKMGTNNSGTFDFMIIAGFRGFFNTDAQDGGVWNYRKINKNSPYSSYVTALDGECPIFLVLKEGNSIISTGHGVFAFGYATGYNNEKFLFVMDGWHNYGRFVKFDYYPKIFGYKIWVRH